MENILEKVSSNEEKGILKIFPQKEVDLFKMGTQIEVDEKHRAVFIKDEKLFDLLGPGNYILSNKRIPKLSDYLESSQYDKTQFKSYLVFINVDVLENLKWGANCEISDDEKQYIIRSFGNYSIKIAQIIVFLKRFLHNIKRIDDDFMKNLFRNVINKSFNDYIKNNFSEIKNEDFLESKITDELKEYLKDKFKKMGIILKDFDLINLKMDIKNNNKIEKRTNEVKEKKVDKTKIEKEENQLDKRLNIGTSLKELLPTGESYDGEDESKKIKCSNCGKEISSNNSFCPYCGEKVIKQADKKKCSHCNKEVEIDSKYCPHCGEEL